MVRSPSPVRLAKDEGHRSCRRSELRELAAAHKITAKPVDLLVKDGFSSMDAAELLDKEDLSQSKIPRGQQKLLLKALQPRQATEAEQTTEQTAEVTEATTAATATCEDGATDPARGRQNQLANETECDVYSQLMYDHLRTIQGATATTPTPQPIAGRGHTQRAATVTTSHFEHCATMPRL